MNQTVLMPQQHHLLQVGNKSPRLLDRDDPIAEVICKNNVGGVVEKSALNVGFADSVWESECEFGLIPTSQSTRLLIAKYMLNNK